MGKMTPGILPAMGRLELVFVSNDSTDRTNEMLLASNCLLLSHPFYRIALVGQMLFYFWAGVGFLFTHHLQRVRLGLVGYFLRAMNLVFLVGFVRFLLGRGEAAW